MESYMGDRMVTINFMQTLPGAICVDNVEYYKLSNKVITATLVKELKAQNDQLNSDNDAKDDKINLLMNDLCKKDNSDSRCQK